MMARNYKEDQLHNGHNVSPLLTHVTSGTALNHLNIIRTIDELNMITSQELNKLLKESDSYTIQYNSKSGSFIQIDMEKLALSLPLHLIAMLLSRSEHAISLTKFGDHGMPLKYFLRGFRLLHTLSDIASRNMRFEQILFDDVRVSEQLLDLVFYMLLILARFRQKNQFGVSLPLTHSALVATSFHLLTSYISSRWQDLVLVLLAHPKVDVFIEVAVDAVHVDVSLLHDVLSTLNTEDPNDKSKIAATERTASSVCHNCEASLQYVLALYQQKLFLDRVLQNKELCKNGGILSLARNILDLNIPQSSTECFELVSALSRLKSKVLSILVQLCEAEHVSYLDEVAGSPKSMLLAKSVFLKILHLLKVTLDKEVQSLAGSITRRKPEGLVLLNSIRLADIISDDSNFRSFFMVNMSSVLVDILAMPDDLFSSSWCSTNSQVEEEDVVFDYDPFIASGMVLDSVNVDAQDTFPAFTFPAFTNEASTNYPGTFNFIRQASYAHHRASYLVKVIANFHCFVPNICQEQEKGLFLHKFCERIRMDTKSSSDYLLKPELSIGSRICKNIYSLKDYARKLIPDLLNMDDLQLLSQFYEQLLEQIPSATENSIQENSFSDDVRNRTAFSADDSLVLNKHSPAWMLLSDSKFAPDHQLDVDILYTNAQNNQSPRERQPGIDNSQFMVDACPQEEIQNKDNNIEANGVSKSLLCHEPEKFDVVSITMDAVQVPVKDDQGIKVDNFFVGQSALGTQEHNPVNFQLSDTNDLNTKKARKPVELVVEGGEISQMLNSVQDDERPETVQGDERQPRKRKRNIMNDKQITLIEQALLNEPEMQRNAGLLQSWADELSLHGSELTPSQLKNWLNNRKARLARAARETRAPSEGESSFQDQSSISHFYDSPDSCGEESYSAPTGKSNTNSLSRCLNSRLKKEIPEITASNDVVESSARPPLQRPTQTSTLHFKVGQSVSVVDYAGNVVGRGKVSQTEGLWGTSELTESICVVAIDRSTLVPQEIQPETVGTAMLEANPVIGGIYEMAWSTKRIFPLPD